MADWNLNPNVNLSDYAAVIYVKADAPEDGDGSKEKPYNSAVKAVLSITEDNTAVLLASGTYEEQAYHIPGSYVDREYCLFGTRVNKNYSVIGDYLNPPTIVPSGGGTKSIGNNYIVSLFDKASTKLIHIMICDVIIRPASDYWNHLLSDLSSKFKHNIIFNNIAFEVLQPINPSIPDWANAPVGGRNHVLYLSSGSNLQINNSFINAPYSKIVYAFGTSSVSITNTIFIVEGFYGYQNINGGTTFNQCSFNKDNLSGIVGKDNLVGIIETAFDENYRNIDEQLNELQIGPYHGTYYWGERDIDPEGPVDPIDPPKPKDKVLLRITMTDSSEREYKLSKQGVADFMAWMSEQPKNPGVLFYEFEKDFAETKEYLLFDKILSFEVREIQ